MDKQIVIIAELRGNQLNPVTYELLAVAQEIRRVNPWPLKIILLGADVERPARELAEASGESVLGIRNSHLEAYNGELTKDLLYEVIRGELDPVSILAAQTTRGLDFGPGLAVRLKAACITGVNALAEKGEGLCFSRAAYHGKIMTHVLPIAETTLLLVQPGAFRAFEKVARDFRTGGDKDFHRGAREGCDPWGWLFHGVRMRVWRAPMLWWLRAGGWAKKKICVLLSNLRPCSRDPRWRVRGRFAIWAGWNTNGRSVLRVRPYRQSSIWPAAFPGPCLTRLVCRVPNLSWPSRQTLGRPFLISRMFVSRKI